jgi:hypothetical protein
VNIRDDRETDSMVIALREERIKQSDEVRPEAIGYDGSMARFEILDVSKHVQNRLSVRLTTAD